MRGGGRREGGWIPHVMAMRSYLRRLLQPGAHHRWPMRSKEPSFFARVAAGGGVTSRAGRNTCGPRVALVCVGGPPT